MASVSAHCIVCERTGRWAGALRSALRDFPRRIEQTRSWPDALTALRAAPASIVIGEVTGENVVAAIQAFYAIGGQFPAARLLAVGNSDIWDWEFELRQAGALDLIDSPRQADRGAIWIRRHLNAHPLPQPTLRHEAWHRLPWRGAQSTH